MRQLLPNLLLLAVIIWPAGPVLPDVPPFMADTLWEAEIPLVLWRDFTSVAYCESRIDATAEGDGTRAKGLFQIHWEFWRQWAEKEGYEFTAEEWVDPVRNTELAYLIMTNYDIPVYGQAWRQWSVKPWWLECQEWRNDD